MAQRTDPVTEQLILRTNEIAQLLHRVGELLGGNQGPRNPAEQAERNERDARREYQDFLRNKPTFERGQNRWVDFARQFRSIKDSYRMTDQQAKTALHLSIIGQSSRLVIASMHPDEGDWARMTFDQYLGRIGEKFTPAAKSLQMEAEYKARKQGKQEDVQNYINAKYELFQLAFPDAPARAVAEFYRETTEGFINKYVRDQMFSYEPASIEAFGAKAVTTVQIERRRIKIGDSNTTSMDGLIPVTRPVRDLTDGYYRHEPMEVDAMADRNEEGDDDLDGCECMAMYEKGFRGPCFYCQREGHMARSCPRKSAGLLKINNPSQGNRSTNQDSAKPKYNAREYSTRRTDQKQEYNKGKIWKSSGKPNPNPYRGRDGKFGKVNQIGEAEEDEESEDEREEWNGEDEGTHFLEEPTL